LRYDAYSVLRERFPSPAGSRLELEITFQRDSCLSVRVNGLELPSLATPELNGKYLLEDYRGSFGLYCAAGGIGAAGDGRPGPTWFSNVVFTPVEK
jgi:hypothetical protein